MVTATSMTRFLRWPILLIAFGTVTALRTHADDNQSDTLHAFIEKGIKDWSVTGLAITVVKDDRIVFMRGYGVRDTRTKEPVDEHTVFQIGSCSKPLSATAFATLVNDGELKWDSRIVEAWPGFRAHDSVVTQQATLRDVLCHRTGVGKGESLLYYEMPITRNELLARLPDVRQAAPFRTESRYSNLMYTVAARVAEEVTGTSWEHFMRQHLFQPVEMNRTFTSWTSLPEIDNVGVPHVRVGDKTFTTKFADRDNIGPAASISSSVSDLSQWLILMTNRGTYKGRRLIRPEIMDEMTRPQILMRFADPVHGEHTFKANGLGVMLFDYHGRRLARHAGMAGHSMAVVGFVPEDRVGVAVLTNYRPSLFHYAVFRRAIDLFCGEHPIDLDTPNRKLFDDHFASRAASLLERQAARDPENKPNLALQKYLGTFQRDFGLRATIESESGAMVLRYGNFVADVGHWYGDTFQARLRERRLAAEQHWYLTFTVTDGVITKLHIHSEHDVHAVFLPVSTNTTP